MALTSYEGDALAILTAGRISAIAISPSPDLRRLTLLCNTYDAYCRNRELQFFLDESSYLADCSGEKDVEEPTDSAAPPPYKSIVSDSVYVTIRECNLQNRDAEPYSHRSCTPTKFGEWKPNIEYQEDANPLSPPSSLPSSSSPDLDSGSTSDSDSESDISDDYWDRDFEGSLFPSEMIDICDHTSGSCGNELTHYPALSSPSGSCKSFTAPVTSAPVPFCVAIPSSQHQMQKQKPAAESLSSLHPKTKPKTSLLGDAVATTEFSPKLVVQRVQSPSDGKKSRLDPFNALFRSTVGKIHAFKDLGAHHHRGAKKWGPLLIGPSIT